MLVPMKLFLKKINAKLVLNDDVNTVNIDEIVEEINVILDFDDYLDLKLNEIDF